MEQSNPVSGDHKYGGLSAGGGGRLDAEENRSADGGGPDGDIPPRGSARGPGRAHPLKPPAGQEQYDVPGVCGLPGGAAGGAADFPEKRQQGRNYLRILEFFFRPPAAHRLPGAGQPGHLRRLRDRQVEGGE